MYEYVTQAFRESVNSRSVCATAKLVFTSPNITIEAHATESLNSSLQELTITDNCYDEGKLIGTAMAKEVELSIINKDNLDLADKEFELFVGVEVAEGEFEFIPYGKYIITQYEDTKSNNIFKIIAYDYMTKLNKLFKDITFNPTFPITLKSFKEQLLTACGMEYEGQLLPNDNFMVNVMPNFDGMTVRNVIGKIAELQGCFAKINRNNKMQFYKKTNAIQRLPREYQEVEYIEGTGTQYINTGIDVLDAYEVIDCQFSGGTSRRLLTETGSGGVGNYWGINSLNQYEVGGSKISDSNGEERGVVKIEKSETTTALTFNGTTISRTNSSFTDSNWNIGRALKNYFSGTFIVYNVKLYDYNDNLLRDFVPCYRKSDNEIGMYDLVNGAFYSRSGTGHFSKGNDFFINEEIDDMAMNSKLEIDKQYGPVNCVALALGGVEGENVTLRDEASIILNGETMITITDNPFVYTEQLRELAINDLFNALNGFTYIPTKFKYKARLYTDCGDNILVEDVSTGNMVSSMILNQYIKIPATRQSELSNLALSDTAIKNQYISQSKQENTKTELAVDKQNQKITALVESNNDLVQKTTQLTIDVDTIKGEIGEIADVTTTVEGYGTVSANSVNESEPILIKIHPMIEDITPLRPYIGLKPHIGLRPHKREIYFIKTNNLGEPFELEYNLPNNLYKLNDIYDEYVLDYENVECYIIHRIGINEQGEKYVLDVPEREDFQYPYIYLVDGDYNINMPAFPNAYIYMRLMAKNIYTSQFATKVELNSKIEQTASSIDLSVERKLLGYATTQEMNATINIKADEITSSVNSTLRNYSTTTQMNSAITQKANQITSSVSETYETKTNANTTKTSLQSQITQNASNINLKVSKDSIVSEINQSSEQIKINANKISLAGKEINLTSDNTTIKSTNFNVDKYGKVAITGGTKDKPNLSVSSSSNSTKIIPNTIFITSNSEGSVSINYQDSNSNKHAYLYCDDIGGGITLGGNASNDISLRAGSNPYIRCYGNMYANAYNYNSLERMKKNIHEFNKNALEIIKNTNLYEFNYNTEKDETKRHIGFVIGNEYKTPSEVISENGESIDSYSMISICWKAVQEQQQMIENLQNKIKEMEGEIDE